MEVEDSGRGMTEVKSDDCHALIRVRPVPEPAALCILVSFHMNGQAVAAPLYTLPFPETPPSPLPPSLSLSPLSLTLCVEAVQPSASPEPSH